MEMSFGFVAVFTPNGDIDMNPNGCVDSTYKLELSDRAESTSQEEDQIDRYIGMCWAG